MHWTKSSHFCWNFIWPWQRKANTQHSTKPVRTFQGLIKQSLMTCSSPLIRAQQVSIQQTFSYPSSKPKTPSFFKVCLKCLPRFTAAYTCMHCNRSVLYSTHMCLRLLFSTFFLEIYLCLLNSPKHLHSRQHLMKTFHYKKYTHHHGHLDRDREKRENEREKKKR